MADYMVEWSIDADDVDSPLQAAQEAWDHMRRSDSIANAFMVIDGNQMAVVVDLHEGTVSDPNWVPGTSQIAELAQYMADEQWDISEIITMISKPQKYAAEYSKMIADRAFDKVAVGPEEIDDDPEETP